MERSIYTDTHTDGKWTLITLLYLKLNMFFLFTDDSQATSSSKHSWAGLEETVFIHCESEPSNYSWRTARSTQPYILICPNDPQLPLIEDKLHYLEWRNDVTEDTKWNECG